MSNVEQHRLASQSFTVVFPDHNIARSPCMSLASKDCHSEMAGRNCQDRREEPSMKRQPAYRNAAILLS